MRCHLLPSLVATAVFAIAPLHQANAQIGFGAMAGGSFSNVTGDLVNDAKGTGTFLIGGFLTVEAAGFAVQPGLIYTRKGFKSAELEGISAKNTFDYVQVPVVLRVGMPVGQTGRFYLGVGPAIGVKVGCRLGASGGGISFSTNCDDLSTDEGGIELKSTEFSGIGEAGLEFGKLSFGIRADLGLSNIYQITTGNFSVEPDVKTRTLSAVIGYRF